MRARRIPQDPSIIGVDDSLLAEFANPPLTTVRLPMTRAGEVAAERIVETLGMQKDHSQVVNTEFKGMLVARESTSVRGSPRR